MRNEGLPRRYVGGFTLIELMVVLTISALVTGGGISAYRGFQDKYQVKQAGAELQTNLKLVQKKASAGEKPLGCLGSLQGFRAWKVDGTHYSFQAECSLSDAEEQTVSLAEDIIITTEDFELFFSALDSAVNGAPETILISTAEAKYTYEITVEANGVIRGKLQ